MIRMIVFDMAGTTINEDNLVYKTVRRALETYDCPVDLPTVLSVAAGKEKREAIKDVFFEVKGQLPESQLLDQIHHYFKEQLILAYDREELKLFDGLAEVLATLNDKGIIRVFNTGYTQEIAQKILTKVGIIVGKDIEDLITADMVPNSRPAPDMIALALSKWSCRAEEVLKVGDSKIDIEEGKNAGVRYAIGITTGAQSREELMEAQPDAVIDHIDGVLKYI